MSIRSPAEALQWSKFLTEWSHLSAVLTLLGLWRELYVYFILSSSINKVVSAEYCFEHPCKETVYLLSLENLASRPMGFKVQMVISICSYCVEWRKHQVLLNLSQPLIHSSCDTKGRDCIYNTDRQLMFLDSKWMEHTKWVCWSLCWPLLRKTVGSEFLAKREKTCCCLRRECSLEGPPSSCGVRSPLESSTTLPLFSLYYRCWFIRKACSFPQSISVVKNYSHKIKHSSNEHLKFSHYSD